MKIKTLISLLVIPLLFMGCDTQSAHTADKSVDPRITVYVVPTITDEMILPDTTIPDNHISNEISVTASRGQYEPASFVIWAHDDLTSVELITSDLVEESNSIPSTSIDIRVVKVWYQAGYTSGDTTHRHLTPELLLKDDSLVKTEDEENYLKMSDGSYLWISDPTPTTDPYKRWSIDEISVQDSDTLQPVNIAADTNKQFWITFKVPDNVSPGIYTGNIELRTGTENLGSIELSLEVLPIELLESYLEYSIYYTARLNKSRPEGSISHNDKSEQQLRAELQNLYDHGITNPTVYQGVYEDPIDTDLIERFLSIRNEVGMGGQPLYWILHGPRENQDPADVPQILSIAQSYGATDVYFYGIDECLGHRLDGTSQEAVDRLLAERPIWEEVQALGGKVFTAGVKPGHYNAADPRTVGEWALVGDILDLIISEGHPSAKEAARWHSVGHRILSYADPVVGEEKPETYRRNYGLSLWQGNYDGTMPWAYNYNWGNPWNDFDHSLRDQMFGYPTTDGVIDTMAFEGWREGVTDARYLATLLNAIDQAEGRGENTTDAENFLVALKTSNLENLDEVRLQLTNHILSLQQEPIIPEKTVPDNAALLFTPPNSYVNCNNNPALNPIGPYTIEIWVRPETAGELAGINAGPICKARDGIGWSWQLRYDRAHPDGLMGFQFNSETEGPRWVRVDRNLVPSEKYYIVGRFDGDGTIDCVVGDGEALEITDTNQISAIMSSDAPLLIGQDGWNQTFYGTVDEVRISNIYRTDEELLHNWNSGKGRKLDNDKYTLALYHMDEAEGDILHDDSLNGNDGIIYNATWVRGLLLP